MREKGQKRTGRLDGSNVRLELLLSLVLSSEVLVGLLELLSILDHLINLGRRQSTNRVGDGDVGTSTRGLVESGNLEETVGVNLEGTDELGLSSGLRGDAGKLEFSEKPVLLAGNTLSLVDGEGDGSLVVLDGSEGSGLVGGDRGVTGNDDTEDVSLHGNTEGERGYRKQKEKGSDSIREEAGKKGRLCKLTNIEKEEISGLLGGLTGKDSGLNGGTVSDGLIGVDGLVELTSTEELGNEGLDLGDTGRSSDEDDIVNLCSVHLGILENLLDGVEGGSEGGGVDLFETGTRDRGGEVGSLEERVDFDGGLGDGRKGSLGTFTGGSQSTHGTGIVRDVELVLAFELLLEVLEKGVVEVLSSQVRVTSGGLDSKDTTSDGKKRDIECSSSEIENEDNLLLLRLLSSLTETVSDGSGGRLVDDTENVETSDGSGILGGETLGVVEVGGNGDDGLLDRLAELGLSGLLEFTEDHGGDLSGRESLLLVQVVDLKSREEQTGQFRSPLQIAHRVSK